jgi:hypothetical protein
MDSEDKEKQKDSEDIADYLDILVGSKRDSGQYKGGAYYIGPFHPSRPDQKVGNVYEKVTWIHKMEKAKKEENYSQQVDRKPGNDVIMFHSRYFELKDTCNVLIINLIFIHRCGSSQLLNTRFGREKVGVLGEEKGDFGQGEGS